MTRRCQQQAALNPRQHFDERLRYTIPESAELLRQSQSRTWAAISAGHIKAIRDGGRTYVPGSEILRLSTLSAEVAA